jgi:protein phosphatase
MTKLNEIVRRAIETDSQEFVDLVEEACEVLKSERDRVGKLKVEGRLAKLKPCGEAIVVGDLHGDLESLVHILEASGFVEKATHRADVLAVFLGDYGDRGPLSPEVYYTVLRLKHIFPENVMLMRGNHEGPDDLQPIPHDLPHNLLARFGDEGRDIYTEIRGLYPHLYTSMIVEQSCVLLHGGIPMEADSLDDLAFAHVRHPRTTTLEEILWSDPAEDSRGVRPSPRGAGRLFGQDVTQRFLESHKVKVLIRGHESTDEGFKVNHQGRVLTLFSRKGAPYSNNRAAYLQLDLSLRPQSAHALTPSIRQF